MRFIGSAVNRVPGALCQKFNHKVFQPKKRLQKKTHTHTHTSGCFKIQKTTLGGPKKTIKIKTFMKNLCSRWFKVTNLDYQGWRSLNNLWLRVTNHHPQKGHLGIARFYKGCLGAGFARHLIATSFHRTSVCKRARCWATQMAEGMKSWHEYWNIR